MFYGVAHLLAPDDAQVICRDPYGGGRRRGDAEVGRLVTGEIGSNLDVKTKKLINHNI